MSNQILDRPTTASATTVTTSLRRRALHVGSYTGTESGVGSYTGTRSLVGTYTGTSAGAGSYVRSQR